MLAAHLIILKFLVLTNYNHCQIILNLIFVFANFYVLLAVHPNIMHLLYSCTCFEHYHAHIQEDNIVLVQSSRNLSTEQSPKESFDTRCCNNAILSS